MFHSLFSKISFSVGFVVTLTLLVFAFFILESEKEYLVSAKKKEAEAVSAVIEHGLTNFMKEGGTKDFHHFLNLFRISDDFMELRILDESGTVLHSSRKQEQGTSLDPGFSGEHPEKDFPPLVEREIRGRPFLTAARIFRNEPACFFCHGDRKRILGILQISLPMDATRRSIRLNRMLLVAATLVTLLVMALAINIVLARVVKRPVARLIETMSQVEGGNLDVKVNLETRDELGLLARNFASMVQKLSAARKEVEKRHREQVLQVRHLASLGELAAGVAHEIRNPLAGIKLAVQILAKEREMADCRETIAEIMRSIERLDKTVNDLLLYSRAGFPEWESFSLSEIIEEALSCVREELQRGGVRVEKTFDPALPMVRLDGGQMVRVFLNLFLNALQAMPGGGTLKIQTRTSESAGLAARGLLPPEESRSEGEPWVEVTVTDTGEGMAAGVLQDIFLPFFTTKPEGVGLGLALSRRIIEQHQGHLSADSKLGEGTTFTLLLPVRHSTPSDTSDQRGKGKNHSLDRESV